MWPGTSAVAVPEAGAASELSSETVIDIDRRALSAARPSPRWAVIIVAAVLALGAAIRLSGITNAPLDFHPSRQYNSALLARKFYYDLGGRTSGVRPETVQAYRQGVIEPPIIEMATAVGWRLAGRELLWIPRVFSVLVWALGSWMLYLLTRRLAGARAAVLAVVVAQLLQFSIAATRVFQPDPLMVTATVGAMLAIVVDDDRRARRSFWVAALVTGLAVLIKPPALFFTWPVFGVLAWRRIRRPVGIARVTLVFAAVAITPLAIYTVLGLWGFHFLKAGDAEGRFLPSLWTTADFWTKWTRLVADLFGYLPFILVAVAVFTRGRTRLVVGSLVGSYLVYGLAFPYHITTHSYYSLPLVPIVALAVGVGADGVLSWMDNRGRDLFSVGVAVLVLGLTFLPMLRDTWQHPSPDTGTVADQLAAASHAAGDACGHTSHAIFVAPADGNPLMYYGAVAGQPWPSPLDVKAAAKAGHPPVAVGAQLDVAVAEGADCFIVTDLDQWAAAPELRDRLQRYPVLAQGDGYLVFSLTSP